MKRYDFNHRHSDSTNIDINVPSNLSVKNPTNAQLQNYVMSNHSYTVKGSTALYRCDHALNKVMDMLPSYRVG